jgi:hypothetical protein
MTSDSPSEDPNDARSDSPSLVPTFHESKFPSDTPSLIPTTQESLSSEDPSAMPSDSLSLFPTFHESESQVIVRVLYHLLKNILRARILVLCLLILRAWFLCSIQARSQVIVRVLCQLLKMSLFPAPFL